MRTSLLRFLHRHRMLMVNSVDVAAWFVAFYVVLGLRFETFRVEPVLLLDDSKGVIPLWGTALMALIASVVHVAGSTLLRLNQGRHEVASFEELFSLFSVASFAGLVAFLVNLFLPNLLYPRLSVLTALAIAFMLMAWPRVLWRLRKTRSVTASGPRDSQKVVVIGAGNAGRNLVKSMFDDDQRQWRPVAFLDDDKSKRHFRHRGVSVEGSTKDIEEIAAAHGAQAVVIAMPSVSANVIGRISDAALEADLEVKVLPGVNELLGGVSVSQVRDLEPADLLGRHAIETDVASIAHFLSGQTVLVTGAGGSIGSELCRQIRKFGPRQLLMLDRDESALHSLALSLDGRADLESPDMLLADIRDRERIFELFEEHRPQVVFHAAALKHVNILEQQPGEAVKTNVIGTQNVLDAAEAVVVDRFVNISTDKAASPENVLGHSKRIAEALTAAKASQTPGTFLSVRFGNVLGTRGSVLHTFASQIENGGPVTVTHPDVTRFFMTVDEAVQLVIQAAAIGRDGEALVLDMGTPVRIDDVARRMIKQSRKQIEIIYTGLKPGEKLHEVLFSAEESDVRPFHPLVSHVCVPPVGPYSVESLLGTGDSRAALRELCETIAAERSNGNG